MQLRNCNPLGAVDLPLIGRTLAAGEVFEVTAEQAGRAPSTSKDADGNDVFDPGEGLLAQVGNYELPYNNGGSLPPAPPLPPTPPDPQPEAPESQPAAAEEAVTP